jgi:cholesterol transport system auxiliary component
MTIRLPTQALLAAALSWAAAGCAVLSKNEPLQPRYFTVEPPPAAAAGAPPRSDLKLRLGAVIAGSDIRQYLTSRSADHELSYSSELRWTERPESYLRRALAYALFEQRGIQRVVSGAGRKLDVELVAFEEVRKPPERVRVSAVITLHDGHLVLAEKTLSREQPLGAVKEAERPGAVARELGVALAALVDEIAAEVSKP